MTLELACNAWRTSVPSIGSSKFSHQSASAMPPAGRPTAWDWSVVDHATGTAMPGAAGGVMRKELQADNKAIAPMSKILARMQSFPSIGYGTR